MMESLVNHLRVENAYCLMPIFINKHVEVVLKQACLTSDGTYPFLSATQAVYQLSTQAAKHGRSTYNLQTF